MILIKSGFKDAPPTKKPSISDCLPSSLQFSAVTEPKILKLKFIKNKLI